MIDHPQDNLDRIDALNSANTGARYGVNKFADLTPKEFKVPHNVKSCWLYTRFAQLLFCIYYRFHVLHRNVWYARWVVG
jgi:hypothetical protein